MFQSREESLAVESLRSFVLTCSGMHLALTLVIVSQHRETTRLSELGQAPVLESPFFLLANFIYIAFESPILFFETREVT